MMIIIDVHTQERAKPIVVNRFIEVHSNIPLEELLENVTSYVRRKVT